jgi:hypothetical protein
LTGRKCYVTSTKLSKKLLPVNGEGLEQRDVSRGAEDHASDSGMNCNVTRQCILTFKPIFKRSESQS